MRLVTTVADRLLSVVVPRVTAGACCPPDPWVQECYCSNHTIYVKTCSYTCACIAHCGGCRNADIGC
jgi:hypothetical protein